MLLTRSPLSPFPKEWFSLDLHVLSAPPAFVLSQDQTLREELFAGTAVKPAEWQAFSFELELKVSSTAAVKDNSGDDEVRASYDSQAEARETMRSRRKRTLLSFQRPVPRSGGGVKKPPTRARGLQSL